MLDVVKFLQEVERKVPVNSWRWRDYHAWPILCGILHNSKFDCQQKTDTSENVVSAQSRDSKNARPPLFLRIKRICSIFLNQVCYMFKNKNAVWGLKKYDNIFLTDGVSQTFLDGIYYENFFSEILEEEQKRGKNNLVFDPGNGLHHTPTKEKVFLLLVRRYLIYLHARIFKKQIAAPSWVGYEIFLKLSEKYLGPLFRARCELVRVSQDFREIDGWRKFWNDALKKTNASAVYLLAYYNHLGWGLCLAAADNNIAAVEFQHGVISENMAAYGGWAAMPDRGYQAIPREFHVWSSNELDSLKSVINPNSLHKIVIYGNPWMRFVKKHNFSCEAEIKRIARQKKINILIAHQYPEAWQACLAPLRDIILENPQWNFWFRRHPVVREKKEFRNNVLEALDSENLIKDFASDVPLPSLLKYMDLVITQDSSVSIDAVFFGIKTIFLLEQARRTKSKVIEQGFATLCRNKNEILETILKWTCVGAENTVQPHLELEA